MTKADVVAAQGTWAKYVVARDVEALLKLYDFGSPEKPLLFKPTLANVIRHDEEAARSYFIGGNIGYPHDDGFLNCGWKKVTFCSAVGPISENGGLSFRDMGNYTFADGNGNETHADYTFMYHKLNGVVLIALQHSSLVWEPRDSD